MEPQMTDLTRRAALAAGPRARKRSGQLLLLHEASDELMRRARTERRTLPLSLEQRHDRAEPDHDERSRDPAVDRPFVVVHETVHSSILRVFGALV